MKNLLKTIAFILFILSGNVLYAQPVISPAINHPLADENGNVWYWMQFVKDKNVAQDMGEDEILKVQVQQRINSQLWKITASGDDYYKIENKSGRKINFSGSHFTTSSANSVELGIDLSTNTDFPGWEIQRKGSALKMNQVAGTAVGTPLGEWNAGDKNNSVVFMQESDWTPESPITGSTQAPDSKLSLWYDKPATDWMKQALPIGNGQFGAMIFGGVRKEEVQFNDKTLWSGNTTTYGAYQNFGSLFIEDKSLLSGDNYRRELDLENGLAKVTFESEDVKYTREYFSSYPDKAVIIHYTANQNGKINANLSLVSAHQKPVTYTATGASFSGDLSLVSYYAKLAIKNDGGSVNVSDQGISVEGANSLTIVLRGNTNFSPTGLNYIYNKAELAPNVNEIVAQALLQPYATIKERHIADYKSLFDRVKFNIDGTANTLPTDNLINAYNSGGYANLFLEELYFHYGRYLMISSARGINLPSNLQGIWNHVNNPPWSSDIHSNINVQMNYWPAESTNLSELHSTFLNYIYNEATGHNQWKQNARDAGQTKGWTLYTENNIFGFHGSFRHNYVIANAWYCTHLWQHYRYTSDTDYLRNTAFPVMKSCCDFWMERLKQAPDGTWVCPNEFSPEHGPASEDGTAHSQQLVWDLFNNTLQAIEALGTDVVNAAFLSDLQEKFAHLDQGLAIEDKAGQINGQLREWKYSHNDVSGADPVHRHLSHLMGLYPGNQIAPIIDVTIFNAAVKSLRDRGDQSTGWSMGWKINLWARALDGDHARSILNRALKLSTTTAVDFNGGGIYQNLFDSHAPFQIDGNFGACAGIAEMLLQSHLDVLQILPALPSKWKAGNVQGLRAVGNFETGIKWAENGTTVITIKSYSGNDCTVKYKDIQNVFIKDDNNNRINKEVLSNDLIKFATESGRTYTLSFDPDDTGIKKIEAKLSITSENQLITITAPAGDMLRKIEVVDLQGKVMLSRANLKQSSMALKVATPGAVVIVKILTDRAQIIEKVVVK
ncbi:MAG: hypothetical protein EZS26_000253 [Candidatus Ordinivivax streblomastigis]|uniref:Alpha-L-fucosidase n=1 Tax=Candidatus Ordinivivax streblomastigis TaxID=2540710 RepID=A0A5M8P5W8_9BACT|nr:MAG: hypothetical protein EZS26_000253 [Candidatus Ordinivivax streblomastigis]